MGNSKEPYCIKYCPLKSQLGRKNGLKDKSWMASSINLKMVAIGKIYLKTYPFTQPYIGIINSGERQECAEVLMRVLHSQVREQVKKNQNGLR